MDLKIMVTLNADTGNVDAQWPVALHPLSAAQALCAAAAKIVVQYQAREQATRVQLATEDQIPPPPSPERLRAQERQKSIN